MMPVPSVSHVEWMVTDLERGVAFLSALFAWRFEVYSTHYRFCRPPAGPAVGLLEVPSVTPSRSTLVHVQVEDLDVYIERARRLGAVIDTPRTEVPGHGWYAHVLDPDGNIIGLFQAFRLSPSDAAG